MVFGVSELMSYNVINVSGELVQQQDLKFILAVPEEMFDDIVGIDTLYFHKGNAAYYTTDWQVEEPERTPKATRLESRDDARQWVEKAYRTAMREIG